MAKEKVTFSPIIKKETNAPVTEAISKGTIDHIVKSIISTSSEKIIAAIGALKIPAIAAEQPQAMSNVLSLKFKLKYCAKLLPMAAPV